MSKKPILMIHGGAWAMPDDAIAAHENGIRNALAAGYAVLEKGGSAVSAVEEAVVVMEDDETFDAGRGSFLTRDGRVQLDALVMSGENLRAGGVACVERLRNPIQAARLVLDDTLSRSYPAGRLKALNVTAGIYETGKVPDSALKYLRMASVIKDSLFNRDKMVAIQMLTNEEQEREKQIDSDNMRLSNRYGILLLLAGFIAISLAALVVLRWQRLRQLQKMRNSIADDLHDDIGSTLSSISIMSELAKGKSPEAIPLLISIEENAISLQENMSDIVWAVNPKNDRFGNRSTF